MAGAYFLASRRDFRQLRDIASRMADGMALYPWQHSSLLEVPEAGVILGAVVHENACLAPSGYCLRDGAVSCVLDGFLIRTSENCGAGEDIRAGRYARAAIAAYRKWGESFAERLEGAFAVLLHDAERNRLIAANGHFANPHLYWRAEGSEIIYGTQLGPLAACGFFAPAVDEDAVGCLLADGALSGTDTLVGGVRTLEMASIASHALTDGSRSSRIYWTFGSGAQTRSELSFARHLDEVCDVLCAAGQRIVSRPGRYVSGLSGGLDSRLVAALATRYAPELKTWTFGSEDSPDMVIAARISAALGVEQLRFPTHPGLVPELAPEYALTVEGCISSEFAYGLERTRRLMDHADIVLNGLAGEVILGDYLLGPNLKLLAKNLRSLDPAGRRTAHPLLRCNRDNRSIAHFMAAKAGPPTGLAPFASRPPRPIRERILEQLEAMSGYVAPQYRAENYVMANRGSRWTLMGIISDRHFYGDGSLFYDYELIDRGMAVPHAYREGNRLYSAVFRRLLPEIGRIPNANTGQRADIQPLPGLVDKLYRGVRRKLLPARSPRQATGNDPNAWSRNLYPDYYRELLADPRTRGRPYWNGPGIAQAVEGHLAGELNLGTPLGLAASIEYFVRRWIDGSTAVG